MAGQRLWFIAGLTLMTPAWTHAEVIPLLVNQGHCECVLPTSNPGDQYFVIVGSLAPPAIETRVHLKTEASDSPSWLPLEKTSADTAWQERVDQEAKLLERARRQRPTPEYYPPLNKPPPAKTFYLFMGERDLENPSQYRAVPADLVRAGRHVQIYLDHETRITPALATALSDIVRIFDQELFPWAEKHLGQVIDVDRDGRFTIFMTPKLGDLQNGKVQVDGFVRGSDFCRDVPAPFSNHADMLYLNAALSAGPHLRTVLIHEYAHAVTFCEHALTPYKGSVSGQDEESWLNEALSHLVENSYGRSWSNLDYRISAYLSCPEKYPLVVPDYYGAGLWREPGTRGAAFLFLQSCARRSDDDLSRRLIQSPLHGAANLEAATRKPFADLFRQASIDLLQKQNYGFLSKGGPLLCGPRYQSVFLDHGQASVTLTGTAAAFFLLHTPDGSHARLTLDGPAQVTVVRLPNDLPRMELRWVPMKGKRQLEIAAQHGDIKIRGSHWEHLLKNDGQPAKPAGSFEEAIVKSGKTLSIGPIPESLMKSDTIFKIWGEDQEGRPVAAWIGATENE